MSRNDTATIADGGSVTLSAAAASQIGEVLAKEARGFLRVAVDGGGCSGFSYAIDFADAPDDGDLVLERDAARVLIDPVSMEYLAGSEIDYVDELIGASFRIHNPQAKSSCGCGTSFSM